MPLLPAPDPRAIPLHVVSPEGLAVLARGPAARVAGLDRRHGLRGGPRRDPGPARPDGAPEAALFGWGAAGARARDRFHLAAAVAKLPAGVYALRPEGELDARLEALGWLMAGYRFDRYRAAPAPERSSWSARTASTRRGSTASPRPWR